MNTGSDPKSKRRKLNSNTQEDSESSQKTAAGNSNANNPSDPETLQDAQIVESQLDQAQLESLEALRAVVLDRKTSWRLPEKGCTLLKAYNDLLKYIYKLGINQHLRNWFIMSATSVTKQIARNSTLTPLYKGDRCIAEFQGTITQLQYGKQYLVTGASQPHAAILKISGGEVVLLCIFE